MSAASKGLRFADVSTTLLRDGYGVRFRATGGSMTPAIGDGDLITVRPVDPASLAAGRVIVYRDCDRLFAHRIVSVGGGRSTHDAIVVRGDAARAADEPIAASQVVGEVVSVSPRPPRRRRFVDRLRRAAALVMAALGALVLVTLAPRTARAAVLQQVQSGTAVNTADGIQTIAISSVDPTKSFLIFQTRSSGDRPVSSTIRGRLASATTIQFERETNEGAPLPINIQWYVATFGSGVTVQRGTAAMSAPTVDVGITAVAAMNQAFVSWSMTPNAAENEFGADDLIAGDLISTTNLQFRTNDPSGHVVWWQVIEFTDPADINVQRGTVTTMTGAATSAAATLPIAVDPARTFVLASLRTDGSGPDVGARLLRTQLTNATTISFDRGSAGSPDDMTEISWQAIELRDGSMVWRGNASFAPGVSQVVSPFPGRVNTTRAIAFASGQAGGQSMGMTTYAGNDLPGVAMATTALAPTQLTLDRGSALAAADVGWFVVQFAGGDGFKVGSFTKTPGAAPASQAIAHGLGEVPKALILWTEGRTSESFSNSSGIAFRAASSGSSPAGVLSIALPVPAGTAANDVMIAGIGFRPSSTTITPPAGWTLLRRNNNFTGSSNSLAVYWKVASTSEPASYTWTLSASAGSAGGIQSFSGVDVANPIDVENGALTLPGLTHAAPTVTTTVTNEMVVTVHSFSSSASWTAPTGMTEAFDVPANAAPGDPGVSVLGSYALQAAPGATGPKLATVSNDPDSGNAQTIALNPAAPGAAYFGYGMTDGTRSRSVSTSSQNGVTTSNASTRMASKALTLVRWGEVVVAEADLASWNDTTFTLNWTTNDASSYVIHFIAVGGSDVRARIVDWQMRPNNGNQTISGTGFQPDVVLHAHGGHTFNDALPANLAGGAFGLGVMDFDGDQWALANWTVDNQPSADTQRGQVTDAAIYSFNSTLAVQKRASWVSMNADGFTLNWTNTASNAQARVFSLALKGLNVKPGRFLKSSGAAPAAQAVTGVGFRPSLVMLASVQSTTQANPVAHSRLGIGASDGATSGSSAVQDEDGAAFGNVDAIDKTGKVFVKVDNVAPAIDAEADLAAMEADGFTLNWTTNDAVPTEILYLSLAPLAVTEVRLISFTAARESQGVHLAWKTGYEVANLGFHLYREIDGQRTRITRSLVAGSGLIVGARNRVTSEQSYGFWDRDAAARSENAVYWLEDVDFNGASTWHGPVTPAAAVLGPGSVLAADSPTLAGLGRGAGYRHERFVTPFDPPSPLDRRTRRVESAATTEESRQAQWTIASQPAAKIGIREAGWYRVAQPSLAAAGLDPQADPATLRLFLEGVEQPILVTGSDDGRFDSSDAIEFYGTGVDTPHTDTAVYWLTAGTGTGLRVQRAPAAPGAPPAPPRFRATVERKDRSIYFAALRNGAAENWFGDLIADGAPVDVGVTVRHPDADAPGPALLEVTLQGVTISADVVQHQVRVSVNATEVGIVAFEGRSLGSATLTVPHALLTPGANAVRLEALGGETDLSLFSTLRLTYWRTPRADDDELLMTAEGGQTVRIEGFTDADDVRVIDVGDPLAVLELTPSLDAEPSSVVIQTAAGGTRALYAFTSAHVRVPLFVTANRPSTLHAAGRSHDYVIVAHPDFVAQMAPLAAHRAVQGYRATVVSIDDVYDEFGFGQRAPEALKDFIARARAAWTVPPRFVVLAGDATFDPRDYAGLGFGDFVPTGLVEMAEAELETASDDWFADSDADGLPELAIGRLPVRTAAQAAGAATKIVAYDHEPAGAWSRSVSLVTDADDPSVRFRASSAALVARVPAGIQVNRLDRDVLGAPTLRQDLFALVSQGQLIVNYLGHGSTYIWGGSGEMLASGDIGDNWSTTGSRLPLVVAMNCLNGFFQGIYGEESLAETMMRSSGGAVAVWASSSLTDAEPQAVMNDELFRLLFGTTGTVGDAVRLAKSAVPSPDVRRSWVFFGDPAMRLKGLPLEVPPLPALTAAPAVMNFAVVWSEGGRAVTPDQIVRVTQTGSGTVVWNATSDQPWIRVENGAGAGSGRFSIGIAASGLPASGTLTGTVTITANGAQSSPAVSIRVSVFAASGSNPPFGTIDTPVHGASGLSGSVPVTGWALDDVGVSRVQIFRDPVSPEEGGPVYMGDAMFIAGARPDVEVAYPDVPSGSRAGWGFMLLTNTLPNQGNGIYTIHALAADLDGNLAWLGSRAFAVDNASATAPFGSIDTPGVSEIASGTTYLNFGWALTPQPKVVPIDGSTISVLVDGVVVGHPGPLGARPDIQALFPGYANTDAAVGAFALDTTAYADGLHTISWAVTDSSGQTSGIGSRYFIIDNSGGSGSVTGAAGESASAPLEKLAEAHATVRARIGADGMAPFAALEPHGGRRQVAARELDRIEIRLSEGTDDQDGWRYRGYHVVGSDRRALPVGSTLDAETGVFSWQPSAGFVGRYLLQFVRTALDGREEQIAIEVVFSPLHPSAADVRAAIDVPASGGGGRVLVK